MFDDLFSFDGRNNRAKFWTLQLVFFGIMIITTILDRILFSEIGPILTIIAILALFIPNLANRIKRWHDRDKSGIWVLVRIIPLIGPIWAFIETGLLVGTIGPNKYGADPLNPEKIIEALEDDYIWDTTQELKDAEKANS